MTGMLEISQALLIEIRAEAEKGYPNECCGFIFGHIAEGGTKRALSVLPNENRSESSEQYHRFTITAADMMRAERYARREKLDIVGFYHSHPDCPAIPSEYDRSHALPVYSYIIVSCVHGRAAELTNQQLDPETGYTKFIKEEITQWQ